MKKNKVPKVEITEKERKKILLIKILIILLWIFLILTMYFVYKVEILNSENHGIIKYAALITSGIGDIICIVLVLLMASIDDIKNKLK